MISKDKAGQVQRRMSILIKAAELVWRDINILKCRDISYYLEQIIQEANECLNIVDPDRNKIFDDELDKV